jgi:hypothetical protein
MDTGVIIFLIVFVFIWIAVVVFIIRRFIWMFKIGNTFKKATNKIIPGVDNIIVGKTNLLKGNLLSNTGLLDISHIGKSERVLLGVNIDAVCCYYEGQIVAGLGHIKLKYTFLDNSGNSLSGLFTLNDGSNNNIKADIKNGLVEFFKNNIKMAILNMPERLILNSNAEQIGKINGNLVYPPIITERFWDIVGKDNNVNQAYSYQPDWSNTISGVGIKPFDMINEVQDENKLIDFFQSLTVEKHVRWPIFPENNTSFLSEEFKMVSIFLATLSYVLYESTYKT